ncbi:hypothetical protein K280104A7_30290 [Candidatus Bariatricus faecipullorum]
MKEILDLIKTMTEYFQSQMTPQSFLDLLVQYVIPILQAIVLVGGAGAGIYKYYQSKNREINEKILSTVYAPLYNYFVKQELYCNLKGLQRDVKQTPILEISSTRVKTKLGNGKVESTREKFSVLNLDRKEFINVLHSVNIGLANKNLYTLLSMYEVVCHEEENFGGQESFFKAGILKVQIENEIRKEIITGYDYYQKKLGLNRKKNTHLCRIANGDIEFDFDIPQDSIDKFREDYESHPERYQ